MLVSEVDRRKIYDIAKELSQDKTVLEKFPYGLDENKVAYLIETMLINDTPLTSSHIVETAEMLFGGIENKSV